MDEHALRFECRPEPSRTWTVWDTVRNAPANLGGCILKGRQQDRAQAACDILQRIYTNRLDAKSISDASN